jgi:hypothetical protein
MKTETVCLLGLTSTYPHSSDPSRVLTPVATFFLEAAVTVSPLSKETKNTTDRRKKHSFPISRNQADFTD